MRQFWFLGAFIAFLTLIGCSQSTLFTFYNDQSWEIRSEFSYDPDEIPEIGFSGSIVEGLNIGASTNLLNPAFVDLAFNQAAGYYQRQGLGAKWEKQENRQGITYVLTIFGQGWEQLESAMTLPEIEGVSMPAAFIEVEELENNQIHVQFGQHQDDFGLGMLLPTTIQLRGRRIVSSNAPEVRGGVATWQYPVGIEAVLIPTSKGQSLLIIGVMVGLVVLIGGGLFVWQMGSVGRRSAYRRQKGTASRPPYRPMPPTRRR